jgi:hypothetical protein
VSESKAMKTWDTAFHCCGLWKHGTLLGKRAIHMQKTETRPLSLTLTNITSKWIKDLNVRSSWNIETITGKTLEDTGIGMDFLNRTSTAQEIRARIGKWDCNKLVSAHRKKQLPESRDNPQNGRKSSPAIQQIMD